MLIPNNSLRKIAAVVVLYQPTNELLSVVNSYVFQVEKLYAVDNSDDVEHAIIEKLTSFKNIHYVSNKGNKGIAHALNVGARMALNDGFSLLLTMDQDTYLPEKYVLKLVRAFEFYPLNTVGIVSPHYERLEHSIDEEYQRILVTMTTGNILNLEVYKKSGPFLESFFIDHVDHEYCLRLAASGYLVVQVNSVKLMHRPGKPKHVFLFGIMDNFSEHSPQRFYYFCRNGYYVVSRYNKLFPGFTKMFIKQWIKEVVKILFQKEKLTRISFLIKSIRDYRNKVQGKLND